MVRRRTVIIRCTAFIRCAAVVAAAAVFGVGCGDSTSTTTTSAAASSVTSAKCVVRLHGKGDEGGPSAVVDGIADVRPTGNADGWGKRQWLYFPAERYDEARAVVAAALDEVGCATAVVDGFSNGAAFAAKLYCRGETFDARVVGYVIDDPVTDAGVVDCRPAAGVEAALYWTGALAADAPAGKDCAAMDWTCDGGLSIGIDAYSADLGLAVLPSPHTDHQPDLDAAELTSWLA